MGRSDRGARCSCEDREAPVRVDRDVLMSTEGELPAPVLVLREGGRLDEGEDGVGWAPYASLLGEA